MEDYKPVYSEGEKFALSLARLMQARKASKYDIAATFGVSVRTVEGWIGGRRPSDMALKLFRSVNNGIISVTRYQETVDTSGRPLKKPNIPRVVRTPIEKPIVVPPVSGPNLEDDLLR